MTRIVLVCIGSIFSSHQTVLHRQNITYVTVRDVARMKWCGRPLDGRVQGVAK